MNSPVAFRACYSDWKLVKTRGVVQVIFEVPLADSDIAYGILGGMPNPASENWFGIAALQTTRPSEDHDRRTWKDVQPSAQAAMRCDKPEFWAFLREEHGQRVTTGDDAATAVRSICGVNSRAHFNTNHAARTMWHQLDDQFQVWQLKERVGA